MIKYLHFILFILLFASCSGVNRDNVTQEQDTAIVFTKVAVLQLPFPEELRDSAVHIFNTDMSVFATFEYDSVSEETRCKALDGQIISYAPSWNLMDCFYEDFNTEYGKIRVGDSWKLIRKDVIYEVHDLESYFSSLEYWPNDTDVFYKEDLLTTIPHHDQSSLKCKIKKVKNDWFLVSNGDFEAWVRWKKGSHVLQDRLRYEI